MKVVDLQEILIDTILNITSEDLKKDETIAEYMKISDIEFDSADNLTISFEDGSEFEVKIKKI
jgi:hypothetical protein